MGHGVSPERILTDGFGQRYPVAPESTLAGLRAKRSASVLILNRDVTLRDMTLGR